MNRVIALVAAVLAVTPARADQARVYVSTVGDRFVMTCNRYGYVLELVPGGQKIYLGASCDTSSRQFGGGDWCLANAGLALRVGPFSAIFPGQEPYCPGFGYSPFYCPC